MTRRERGGARRHAWWPAAGALAVAWLGAASAAPPDPRRSDVLVLEIRPLTAVLAGPAGAALPTLVVDPARGGQVEFEVLWPGEHARCAIRIEAHATVVPGRETQTARVKAELTLADSTRVRAERELQVAEASPALFEVYRLGDVSLTLAVRGTVLPQTLVSTRPRPGPAVRLEVEVQRADGGRVSTLETNRLESFVGEPVTYSFRIAEGHLAELRLTVSDVAGDVAKLRVEVTGVLPGGTGPQAVARTEEWMTTRGAPTTIALELGDPPTGYRFVVRPWF